MDDRGCHTICDIAGASVQLLATLQASGFTAIRDMVHKFSVGAEGVTGLFLLSESHLSYLYTLE